MKQIKVYEVSYYLPNNPGNSGGTFTYLAESKIQLRAEINKLHPRKTRMVDGKDTLVIDEAMEAVFPMKIA